MSNTITYYWTIDISSQFYKSQGVSYNLKSFSFLSQLTADYTNANFTTSLAEQINSGNKVITYSVNFDQGTTINEINLSYFIYDTNISTLTNYGISS